MPQLVRFTCRGVSPLFMNAMYAEDMWPGCGCCRIEKDPPSPEAMARRRLYTDERGRVGIPAAMFFAALRAAGRDMRIFRGKGLFTSRGSRLKSVLQITEEFLPVTPSEWKVDVRKGNFRNHRGRITSSVGIARPRFDEWRFHVTIRVDARVISVEKLRELIEIAGQHVGMGSFRPANNGTFGKFRLTRLQQL